MANQYYKNFILWGEVDFYCLLCVESFQDLAELDKHIRWENHRKLLKAQVKNHNFKTEIIYKIRNLYYCEVCNFVTSSKSKDAMNSHIKSEEHKNNKQRPKTDDEISTLCKQDCDYVIVRDVIIEDKDWNCITYENYCLVCSVRIPALYVADHMSAPSHVINLIAARIVVDGEKLYRKLYNNSFYCLCCKESLPMSLFEGHWTSIEHCIFRDDCIFKTTYANENAARAIEEKKKNIERALIVKTQQDHYDILEEKNSAICKKCNIVVKLDFKIMNDHKKSHDKDPDVDKEKKITEESVHVDSSSDEDTYEVTFSEITDHGQRRRELANYGKENYIRLNSGGSKGYCSLCCTTVSGHLKLFKEHVRGARHRGHLELKGLKKSKIHKILVDKFKTLAETINNLYFAENLKLLCLNREICIDVHSFILVYEIEKRFQYKLTKCLICDVLYPYSFDFDHYRTEEHKKRLLTAKVLVREGEFVREIRPDVYHCGFCNKVYPFWELMEKHINSKPHNDMKNFNKYKVFEQHHYDNTLSKVSSKIPDILYLQLLSIGIIRSKSVLGVNTTNPITPGNKSVNIITNASMSGVNPIKDTTANNKNVNVPKAAQDKC